MAIREQNVLANHSCVSLAGSTLETLLFANILGFCNCVIEVYNQIGSSTFKLQMCEFNCNLRSLFASIVWDLGFGRNMETQQSETRTMTR